MFAVIDIETTGGSVKQGSRIIEIACYVFDGDKIVDRFQSLVNPDQNIPWFISNLTGITNEMVNAAPRFFEVAQKIVQLTEGKIFVGHNVQFDYGFVKSEFQSLGYNYERETFCTCKSARKLIPGFPSYSLGRLAQSLGIKMPNHHRAADDALATTEILQRLIDVTNSETILSLVKPAKEPDLNELLDKISIKELPETTGVYYFYDKDGSVIYIGKAKNIRKRVLSHFKNKSSSKTARLRTMLADVDYMLTGTELLALVLESSEIKKHQPVFNRSQKRKNYLLGFYSSLSPAGYLNFIVDDYRNNEKPLAAFSSQKEAEKFLIRQTDAWNLCPSYMSLDKTKGACYKYHTKSCNGACIQIEGAEQYNFRAEQMIESFSISLPDVLLIDKGKTYEEKSALLIENGELKGYGFFNPLFVNSSNEIKECITAIEYHPDFQSILRSAIRNKRFQKIIELKQESISA